MKRYSKEEVSKAIAEVVEEQLWEIEGLLKRDERFKVKNVMD